MIELEIEKVLVKEGMNEPAIGQWVKPAKFELAIVPIHIPVFNMIFHLSFGTYKEFSRFVLRTFEEKLEHKDANAVAVSFEKDGVNWNFFNISKNEWRAEDYGTICHELHHTTHFSLSNIGVKYGEGGEEVYAYLQGHLMELVCRAFMVLNKVKSKKK